MITELGLGLQRDHGTELFKITELGLGLQRDHGTELFSMHRVRVTAGSRYRVGYAQS